MAAWAHAATNQPAVAPTVVPPSPDTVARIHWIGRRKLDLDANAYFISRVWSLRESLQLQMQTLDKVSTNTWSILLGNSAGSIFPTVLLRPLLDDFALEESYFELRQPTNLQMADACFAIHVPDSLAGIWITNAAIATTFLTGGSTSLEPAAAGWFVKNPRDPSRHTRLSHIGEWIVIATGSEHNPVYNEITNRISRFATPVPHPPNQYWIEADIKPALAARALSLPGTTPSDISRIQLNVTGDGRNVITEGTVTLSNAFSQLEPWNPPSKLIHEPLLGFTAIRGVQPFLAPWKMWNDLQLGPPPGEFFFWSLSGTPFQTYFAVPGADAAHQVSVISDHLLQKGNPWLATNGYISFNRAADSNGIVWGNMQAIQPFLKSANGFLYGGLLPDPGAGTNGPMPVDLLQKLNDSNLVYFDWEKTGDLVPPRLSLTQTARQIARRPTMSNDCLSLNWLGTLIPRLGPTETTITQTAPLELTFHRKSTLGFTAIELHLLADWLESPTFPLGLHSLPASE